MKVYKNKTEKFQVGELEEISHLNNFFFCFFFCNKGIPRVRGNQGIQSLDLMLSETFCVRREIKIKHLLKGLRGTIDARFTLLSIQSLSGN